MDKQISMFAIMYCMHSYERDRVGDEEEES